MKLRAFFIGVLFISMGVGAQTTTVNTNNTNTNNNTSTSKNENVDTVTSTNTNINRSTSDANSKSLIDQTLRSPPPTAIAPAMMSGGGNDLCTTGVSGAIQTQILGFSAGKTVTDLNCERLKLSKTLFDMGMKVAAVSTMCQDERVFKAMMDAGTPCPIDGKIGAQAKALWEEERERKAREPKKGWLNFNEETQTLGVGLGGLLLLLLAL
jgi:hypothetical protein